VLLGPGETRDRLTRDIWLVQRARGHRFSSDDVITAFVAARAAPDARRILDLGCGIGSVLLHLAWTHPCATLVGVEAQDVSYELLVRNVAAAERCRDRIAIHHGDLRELATEPEFSLVTGTPPYFPIGNAVDAMDTQRAYARIEYRGGIEDYLAAAGRALAPGGVAVVCGDARASERASAGAAAAGLEIVARLDAIPRAGQPALFAVWTLRHATGAPVAAAHSALTLRDEAGAVTADARMLRAFSGL
jgi:tRNA1Val (adenine37-N6)-methyltransferase